MASLGSGNITIAYPNGDRSVDTSITPRKKYVNLKLTMASGEWPSAGITLPSKGSVGLIRQLDYYEMTPWLATASGKTFFVVLTTGQKIRAVQNILASGTGRTFQILATTTTVGAKVFYCTAIGW